MMGADGGSDDSTAITRSGTDHQKKVISAAPGQRTDSVPQVPVEVPRCSALPKPPVRAQAAQRCRVLNQRAPTHFQFSFRVRGKLLIEQMQPRSDKLHWRTCSSLERFVDWAMLKGTVQNNSSICLVAGHRSFAPRPGPLGSQLRPCRTAVTCF